MKRLALFACAVMISAATAGFASGIGDLRTGFGDGPAAVPAPGTDRETAFPEPRAEASGYDLGDLKPAQGGFRAVLKLNSDTFWENHMPTIGGGHVSAPKITATFAVKSAGSPVTVFFPNGQTYEIVVRDEDGGTVYVWSANKKFTMVPHTAEYDSAGRKYEIVLDGFPAGLRPGRYVVEATLKGQPSVSAKAAFTLSWAY